MSARIGASALVALGMLVVSGVATASADSGDGKASCNVGEICLSRDFGSYTYQKHFYYGANHDGYYWYNVPSGWGTSIKVQHSASAIKNRDRSCKVKVVDDRGALPDNYSTFAPNDTSWRYVGDQVNDKNDRHERC